MTNPSVYLIHKDLHASSSLAIVCGDRTVSYSQLRDAVAQCSQKLRIAGVVPGDRVGITGLNSPEYIIALFGLWSIKAVACPLSTRLPAGPLHEQLRSIGCRYLMVSSATFEGNNITYVNLNTIAEIQSLRRTGPEEGDQLFHYPLGQEATIMFTSGSGSIPKAALHTFANHYYSAKGSNEQIPVASPDGWLLSLPLYHVGGLSILFRVLIAGGTVVIPESKETVQQALGRYKITHISLVPTQFARLLADKECPLKSKILKAILIGGSAVPGSLLEQSRNNQLTVYTTYGLTETASQVATSKYPQPVHVLNYREVKISDAGEILVKGKILFKGYVENDMTHLPVDKDGWFATGDLGYITDDGGLAVTGRMDNMFISGGENIQPEEIEQYLYQMTSIEQAVVTPIPHKEFGFRPVAFVKTHGNWPIKSEDLTGFLRNHLPKFKIPEQFYAWPDTTESSGLKINRRYLARVLHEKNPTLKQID